MEGRRSRTVGLDVPSVPGPGEHAQEDSDTDEVEMTLDAISLRRMLEYLASHGHLSEPTVAGTPSPPVANLPASALLPSLTADEELKVLFRQFLANQLASATPAVPPSAGPSAPPTLPVPTIV
jgi:hypothetical protein